MRQSEGGPNPIKKAKPFALSRKSVPRDAGNQNLIGNLGSEWRGDKMYGRALKPHNLQGLSPAIKRRLQRNV